MQVWSPYNKILNCEDQSNSVWSTKKTGQGNDVINRIGPLYSKNETKLSCPIRPGIVYDTNWIGQRHE